MRHHGLDRPPGTTKADIDHCVDVLAPVVIDFDELSAVPDQSGVSGHVAKSQIIYQNAGVKAQAQAGVAGWMSRPRKHNRGSPRWKTRTVQGCRMTAGA